MFVIISKLDAQKLVKMDYIMNFGVPILTKEKMMDFIENGGKLDHASELFKELPFMQVLKMYRYFDWAD